MKLIITGSSGFLGGELINILKKNKKYKIIQIPKNINLLSKKITQDFIRSHNPDILLHLAAFVPKTKSDFNNLKKVSQNHKMLLNVVSKINCPIIFISSMTVYEGCKNRLYSETDTLNPMTKYAIDKLKSEKFLKKNKFDSFILRIPGLYGVRRKKGLIYNLTKSIIIRW